MLADRYGFRASERAFDMLLAGAALDISRSIDVSGGQPTVDIPLSAFELLDLAPRDRIIYGVFGPGGALVTGYPELAAELGGTAKRSFAYTEIGGERYRIALLPRSFAERSFSGDVTVIVGHTMIARAALTGEIVSQALIVLAAAGSAILAMTVLAVWFSLSPLRRIEGALRLRDPKDLRPIEVDVPIEISANVRAINTFMGRLSNRINAMQALIADASHQLLTPITALNGFVQASAENPALNGRGIAAAVLDRTEEIANLARQLINQAMIIHRSDTEALAPLDLRLVMMQVERALVSFFPQREDHLWLVLPVEPVIVLGDEISLIEALKNLVTNAYRYGEPPIRLIVTKAEDGMVGAYVEDAGKGISPERWAEIGKRFAHDRDRSAHSHGIGLAITNAVCKAHGGTMHMEHSASGRFRCGMKLPAAPADAQVPDADPRGVK